MLTKLTLRYFQRHKKLVLDLSPTVTVLVGRTDSGKSAVIRAARWLALNQPSGDAFVRWGAKGCSVALEIDGHEIERCKGKRGNLYLLDGQEYKSFGTAVPEPITKLLNLNPTSFALQHDPAFWLSLPAPEVSRQLNAVVNLDTIDSALANAASEVRRARAAVDVTAERLQQAQQRKEALAWVSAFCDKLGEISKLGKQADQERAKSLRLRSLLEAGERAALRSRTLSRAILAQAKAIRLGKQAKQAAARVERLRKLLEQGQRWEQARSAHVPDLAQAERLRVEHQQTMERIARLRTLLAQGRQWEDERCRANKELAAVERSLRAMQPSSCPTCGQMWKS